MCCKKDFPSIRIVTLSDNIQKLYRVHAWSSSIHPNKSIPVSMGASQIVAVIAILICCLYVAVIAIIAYVSLSTASAQLKELLLWVAKRTTELF